MSTARGETRTHPFSGTAGRRITRLLGGELGATVAAIEVIAVLTTVGGLYARSGHQDRIGTLGLLQALPLGYFVCLGLVSLTFFWELLARSGGGRSAVLAAQVTSLVVLLHGASALVEREPRFATAWLHAGFVSQILEHHVAAGDVDARFNWPGFFGAAAAVTGAGGLHDALPLLRWAPVVMVLLYLLPLYVIGDHLTSSPTVAWLGLWFFVLVNWVGQDYFAPQSLAFLLYLVAIAILVTHFRELYPQGTLHPGGPSQRRQHRLRRLLPPRAEVLLAFDGRSDRPASTGTRILLMSLLLVILVAIAMSHQLTPIVLTIASGGLVLTGRCRLTLFPVLAGMVTLVWISIGTTDYWVGHLHILFGGLGDVRSVVSGSVGDRVDGSAGHLMVVRVRLSLTAGVWLLMGVAAIRLLLARRPPLTLFVLATAPFLTLVQSYGSEGVLRVFLFSSPFAAVLIAQATVPILHLRWMPELIFAVALVLLPTFVLTRYGNEAFEQVRSDEVAGLRELYATAPEGSVFFSPTSQVPWRFEGAVEYRYRRPDDVDRFVDADPAVVRDPVSSTPKGDGRTYLVVTQSQVVYGIQSLGYPADWFARLSRRLTPRNGYDPIIQNADTWIYQFERQP